ncbi:MAG: SDR family NAD(P)-dependent oxidoreductase, partial [Hymenobacter sp.]
MTTPTKTAVVTGANSGIGFALTQKLLAEGYRVIGTSRSGQIADFSHPNLTVVTLDVTSDASIEQAVAQISQLAPSLDLLVNNAGVGADLGTIVPERQLLRDTFATNVDGTILFTEPMLPLVRDGGVHVNGRFRNAVGRAVGGRKGGQTHLGGEEHNLTAVAHQRQHGLGEENGAVHVGRERVAQELALGPDCRFQ